MATTTSVTKNGDLIRWEIPLVNNGSSVDTNIVVSGTLPTGIALNSSVVPSGTSLTTGSPYQWTVPSLNVGEANKKILVIYTKVTDIFEAPFTWTWTVSSDNTDPVASNNTLILTVEATTCPPTASGSDQFVCGCVSLSSDTPCSHCDTEWRLDMGSISNLNVVDWDQDTGTGSFTHDDPTQDGTIEYNIHCVNCADASEYNVSGPHVLTLPALFDADFDLAGLEVHPTMLAAFTSLGANRRFIWSEANLEGVSSPYNSTIGVTKDPS